ncbi:hypothetical protein TNCV_395681 [Trichonephila clavipes]|nr:hypothetical protein TNCV_395681 [Trichonephila clavipes]
MMPVMTILPPRPNWSFLTMLDGRYCVCVCVIPDFSPDKNTSRVNAWTELRFTTENNSPVIILRQMFLATL